MKKYHNNLATTRNGKVIMPEGDYYLVSEVDASMKEKDKYNRKLLDENIDYQNENAAQRKQIADLTGRLKVANETLVYAAGLKADNQRYREMLEEIVKCCNAYGVVARAASDLAQATLTKTEVKLPIPNCKDWEEMEVKG